MATKRSMCRQILFSKGRNIFVWVFFLAFSLGLVISLLPNITTRVFASKFNNTAFDNTQCRNRIHDPICQQAQQESGKWLNFAAGGAAIVTFSITPMIGTLSDLYGRKWFLALGTVLSLGPLVILTFVYIVPSSSLYTLHLYFYASIVGGGIANFGLAVGLMYIADMYVPAQRAVVFAGFLATVELVLIGAPILGVRLYEWDVAAFHGMLPWIGASFFFAVAVVTAMCLPEPDRYKKKTTLSLDKEHHHEHHHHHHHHNETRESELGNDTAPMSPRLVPWSPGTRSNIKRAKSDVQSCLGCKSCAFNPFTALLILNRSNFFRFLALTSFFQNFVVTGMNVISSYVQLYALDMTLIQLSNANAIQSMAGVVVQILLVQPLIACLGLRKVMHIGNLSLTLNGCALLFIVYNIKIGSCTGPAGIEHPSQHNSTIVPASMTTEHQCTGTGYVWTPALSRELGIVLYITCTSTLGSLAMLAFPAVSALKANNVSMNEQGGALGALWSARALASAISPFVFGSVWTLSEPWMVYYLYGGFSFLALLSGLFVPAPEHFDEHGGGGTEQGGGDGGVDVEKSGYTLIDPLREAEEF